MSRDVCLQGELSAGEAQHSCGHGDQHLVLVTLGLGDTIFTPTSVCRVAGCQTTACAFSVMTVPEMWSKTLAERATDDEGLPLLGYTPTDAQGDFGAHHAMVGGAVWTD